MKKSTGYDSLFVGMLLDAMKLVSKKDEHEPLVKSKLKFVEGTFNELFTLAEITSMTIILSICRCFFGTRQPWLPTDKEFAKNSLEETEIIKLQQQTWLNQYFLPCIPWCTFENQKKCLMPWQIQEITFWHLFTLILNVIIHSFKEVNRKS